MGISAAWNCCFFASASTLQFECPPSIVSPLWLEESLAAKRRLVEKRYVVGRPMESLLTRPAAPGSAGGVKKRRRASALPKPSNAYDLDLLEFSSTQAIMAQHTEPTGASSSRLRSAGAGRCAKRGRGGSSSSSVRGRGASVRLPAVVEEAAERCVAETLARVGLPVLASGGAGLVGAGTGAATQAAARVLTVDLPEEPVLEGSEGEEDDDELSTPLSVRLARSGAGNRSGQRSTGPGRWSGGDGRLAAAPAAPEGDASGGRPFGGARSRLAQTSGPHDEVGPDGLPPAATAQEQGGCCPEAEAMQEDGLPDGKQQQDRQQQQQPPRGVQLPASDAAVGAAQAEEREVAATEARRSKGVAERFSVRALTRNLEKPLLVHKVGAGRGTGGRGRACLPKELPADASPTSCQCRARRCREPSRRRPMKSTRRASG